jgi:hypothetical protein
MTAPSKLSVEIAEALNRKLSGILTAETVTALAALIDAKLAPLVEDGARIEWLDGLFVSACEPEPYRWNLVWGHNEAHLRAAIDLARAQRPAQEGSDKP